MNINDGRVYMENGNIGTNNGDANIYIEVSDLSAAPRPKAGGWKVIVNPVSVPSPGAVHIWSYSPSRRPTRAATSRPSSIPT